MHPCHGCVTVVRISMPPRIPTEMQEQITVADWLRKNGIIFAHVPNEGARTPKQGAMLRRIGLHKGVPDLLIFSHPQTAIEMKRRKERPTSRGQRATPDQKRWLETLARLGWETRVCHGSTEAIQYLQSLGFGQ